MKHVFSSYADFLDRAADEKAVRYMEDSRSLRNSEWKGPTTFCGAMYLARDGWPEGLALIERHKANFDRILGERVRRPVLAHDVAGFAPDVGAFLAGEPESMFSRETVETVGIGRILRIVVNRSVSCGISSERIMERGAFICAAVDALESAGYSCELSCVATCSESGGHCETEHDFIVSIPVKSAGEPLELDRAAFALAHTAFFRRLVFSVMETDAPFMARNSHNYGYPAEAPEDMRGDLYFGRALLGEVDDRTMREWTISEMQRLGITFDE